MLIYLVDISTYHIDTDEETRIEMPFGTKDQSLTELEELISSYADSYNSTYVIHNIKYLGYPFHKFESNKIPKKYNLQDLLKGITDENRHDELL